MNLIQFENSLSVDALLKQWEFLKGTRVNFDTIWQEVKDLTWPAGDDFTTSTMQGDRRSQNQWDMTGALALEKFAAVMESLLTPRQQRFHHLTSPMLKGDRRTAEYFEQVEDILFKMRGRPRAGFYDQMHTCYKSLGSWGNKCIDVDDDPFGGILYRVSHIGKVWVQVGLGGRVNTIFYEFSMTAQQAFEKWGPRRIPECVRKKILDKKPYDDLKFLHVIKPNLKVDRPKAGPGSGNYRSWEISIADRTFIPWEPFKGSRMFDEGVYDTIKYVYSRYTTNSYELYGRGPLMLVLADNNQLQEMERSTTRAGQISHEPPLLTVDDDLFGDSVTELDLRPGVANPGWLSVSGEPLVKPLISGFNYAASEDAKAKKRDIIHDACFITLFQILVDTPEMTATEALIRAQEKGMLIAPVVGRQQGESLGRIVEREIDLMSKQGRLPDMPQQLVEARAEYEIEYASQATRLQREEEVQAVMASIADARAMAEADPTVHYKIDYPAALEFVGRARGMPEYLLRDKRAFMEAIAGAQQASANQESVANTPGLARAAKDLSGAGINVKDMMENAQLAA